MGKTIKKRRNFMVRKCYDLKYRFISIFDTDDGSYMRTGILDDNWIDTNVDPFMASFPHLLDIGVMGHCVHGKSGLCLKSGVECYQNGLKTQTPNMSLENFKKIIDEASRKGMFQCALGGRGDVDQHENFEELLAYCRKKGVVPNFTSSGLGFNEEIANICKKYCGAVAISWYRSPYTLKAIDLLLKAGVTTNVHYVLGRNSIDEAIDRLQHGDFPKGINAVIFLLHKPVGLGTMYNVLSVDDPKVKQFFELVDEVNSNEDKPFSIGFDSCSIPGILNYTKNIDECSIDSCEGGRFSAYISADMVMMPCSFDNQELRWGVDVSGDTTLEEAWNSEKFNDFRSHFHNSCKGCSKKDVCMGGCPIRRSIVLCNRAEKDLK